MTKFDVDKYVEMLYKNQNIGLDETQKKLYPRKEYYKLIKEVVLELRDNKNDNIQKIRNTLFKKSNVEMSLRNFYLKRMMAPGAVISYGTKNYQEIITIGNKSEVDLKNNIFVDNQISMKEETIFDLASITKLFTSLCILILIQNNKIKFEDKLEKYAPQFENIKDVTILDLLTFEPLETIESIKNTTNKKDAENILFTVKKKELKKGERIYNDLSYMVLKYVIENASGLSYKDFLQQEILEKLNMKNTFVNLKDEILYNVANSNYEYRIDYENNFIIRTYLNFGISTDDKARILGQPEGILSGHAGLFSNIYDMIILVRALIDEKIIQKDLLYEISKNRRGCKFINDAGKEDYANYYGLGVYCKNPNLYNSEVNYMLSGLSFASSGWTGTQLTIDPLNNINFILLSNRSHNRVTIIDKSLNKNKISIKKDSKNMIILSNGDTIIDSSLYAWEKELIINECIKLAMKYKILEDITEYNGKINIKSRTIK